MSKDYPYQSATVSSDGKWRLLRPDVIEAIENAVVDALNTDGAHHKQKYLLKIAHMLDLDLEWDEFED